MTEVEMQIDQLDQPVRSFLDRVDTKKAVVLKDKQGCTRFRLIPSEEVVLPQREAALRRIEQFQQEVGQDLAKRGIDPKEAEREINRLLMEE